jgi:hypothetical protein
MRYLRVCLLYQILNARSNLCCTVYVVELGPDPSQRYTSHILSISLCVFICISFMFLGKYAVQSYRIDKLTRNSRRIAGCVGFD